MNENMQALEDLQTRAQEELAATESVAATEAWFRDYLGRNGAVTNFLRGPGDLPRAERPAAGRAGNRPKTGQHVLFAPLNRMQNMHKQPVPA